MNEIICKPIGIIHTPFKEPKNVPIQTTASDVQGTIDIFPEYIGGLEDLNGFSHIILLYNFNLVNECKLKVKPFLDDTLRGIFATRSPSRPNRIGISVVSLLRMDKNILHIQNVDIIDGTPLLDIKPYVPQFDCVRAERIGWFSDKINKLSVTKDDGRFCKAFKSKSN